MAYENHWLPGFNFNVEEWFEGDRYETLAICRSLELARAAFKPRDRGECASVARLLSASYNWFWLILIKIRW
jgi:hypothetical protein